MELKMNVYSLPSSCTNRWYIIPDVNAQGHGTPAFQFSLFPGGAVSCPSLQILLFSPLTPATVQETNRSSPKHAQAIAWLITHPCLSLLPWGFSDTHVAFTCVSWWREGTLMSVDHPNLVVGKGGFEWTVPLGGHFWYLFPIGLLGSLCGIRHLHP